MFRSSLTKTLALGALALSLAFPGAGSVQAQSTGIGLPGGPFATAFRIQNLGGSNATCQYVLYSADGSTAYDSAATLPAIAPDDSAYIFTPDVTGIPAGQTLSGIVSCDQPVAAVVNFSDANSGDTYVGTSAPAQTLFIPSAYNNFFGFFTTLRIMDASGAAQQVTVEFFAPGSSTPVAAATKQINLAANGSTTLEQRGAAGLNPDVSYSVRVRGASGPVAALVSIYGDPARPDISEQLYAFSAFSDGATKLFVPVIMSNFFGLDTAITVQNIGTEAATVRITYSNNTVTNRTIQPGSSDVFVSPQVLPASDELYSATIESTNAQKLIVTVNESNAQKRASTYEGQASGGRTLVAPIVMKEFFNFGSSITCQNVGTANTNVSVTYRGTSGGNAITPQTRQVLTGLVPNGEPGLIGQFNDPQLPTDFIGSAILTASQDIICVVNQDLLTSDVQDQLYAYNAIVK